MLRPQPTSKAIERVWFGLAVVLLLSVSTFCLWYYFRRNAGAEMSAAMIVVALPNALIYTLIGLFYRQRRLKKQRAVHEYEAMLKALAESC